MLMLTRRAGEEIVVGNDISFHIIEIKGRQVRVGISAPKRLSIHRKEVWLRIQEEGVRKQPRLRKLIGRK